MEKSKKQLITYIVVTFALTWAYEFGAVWPAAKEATLSGVPSVKLQILVSSCMFFPALGMVLTRLITREGFGDMLLRPRFKGHGREYLLAYFAPGLLTILGAALYFLLFPGKLDWTGGYYRSVMAASGNPYEAQAVPIKTLLALQAAQGLLLAGLLNLIPSLGEEWGWRGYMMPRLLKTMKPLPALLLGGVIWGLWHAPLTAIGHNYGTGYPGFPWTGIAMMCLFCVTVGTLLTWLTERTGSCIPAAVAHGAVNGTSSLGLLLTADGGNPFVGPMPTGIIGAVPWIAAAVLAGLWLVRRKEKTLD